LSALAAHAAPGGLDPSITHSTHRTGMPFPHPAQQPNLLPSATQLHLPAHTFVWPVRIYWEDTDAGGIVFYANYLKFFERARTEWLRALGISQQGLRTSAGGLFVVSETTVKYHRPARLDDLLLVTAQVQELGRVSITLAQQALSVTEPSGPTQVHCEGSIRIGWVDALTLRPARIPPHILEALK
jgi:acyl-CoA thioester hydrolase